MWTNTVHYISITGNKTQYGRNINYEETESKMSLMYDQNEIGG